MIIAIGCDHAGVELKGKIRSLLETAGITVQDFGTNNSTSVDYPDFGAKVSSMVSKNEAARGILICGTGIGMSIVANKFKGVRAALCHDTYTARMSRLHNDSNILVIGSRIVSPDIIEDIVNEWLKTDFEGGRHTKRLQKITEIEDLGGYNK